MQQQNRHAPSTTKQLNSAAADNPLNILNIINIPLKLEIDKRLHISRYRLVDYKDHHGTDDDFDP
jgi:hypothetical protein